MSDISKERRANIRKFALHRKELAAKDGEQFPSVSVDPDELLALLDAADEHDRLREALAIARAGDPCRYCDGSGEFYGNLNIPCSCAAGADFVPRPEDHADAPL